MSNTVYSYYCFDILHLGHIIDLKKSKEIAGKNGKLIVGVLTDDAIIEKKPPPILSFSERFEIANSMIFPDRVVPQKEYSPMKNLKIYKPNILMESTSHSIESINEMKNYMRKVNGRVVINPYYEAQSSSKIKQKIKETMLNEPV